MKRQFIAILLLSAALLGCGQKGPLYIPQAPDSQQAQ
jgi:predicted small lipoprotein YifL